MLSYQIEKVPNENTHRLIIWKTREDGYKTIDYIAESVDRSYMVEAGKAIVNGTSPERFFS